MVVQEVELGPDAVIPDPAAGVGWGDVGLQWSGYAAAVTEMAVVPAVG